MVRQERAQAVGRLFASLGIAVAAWALTGCGGSESGTVAAESRDATDQTVDAETEPNADERIETVASEGTSSQATAQSGSEDAAVLVDDDNAGASSPEVASTGPPLEWTELDVDLPFGFALRAMSDGRIVAVGGPPASDLFSTTSHLLVTEDGEKWTQVSLPEELYFSSIDMSDERVAISGRPREAVPDGDAAADLVVPVFLSGDQGATWSQATLDIEAAHRDLGVDETVGFSRTSVYVSGDDVVAAVQGHVRLDVESLLVDGGLVDADADIAGWSSEGDSVRVWLNNGDGTETELHFAHDDLALTDSQRALLGDERDDPLHGGRIFLFAGDETGLAFHGSYSGWAGAGRASDDGFHLIVSSEAGDSLVTSGDGESWSAQPLGRASTADVLHLDAFAPDGTLWTARFSTILGGGDGSSMHRRRVGESGSQTAHFAGMEFLSEPAAGLAGLVVVGWRGLAASDSANDPSLPDGILTKDGYELRINEPEGGMTLWDMTAREAVYVFGAESVQSGTAPPGVRTEGSGDSATLTFEDPQTGEDLVAFTILELIEVMGPPPTASDVPEQWVGWSADGIRWGWQSAQDAFGLADTGAVATFAVGDDFAIAMVWLIPAPDFSAGADAGDAGQVPETRWFIARVP